MISLWPAAVRYATKVLLGNLQDSDGPLVVTSGVTRMNERSAKTLTSSHGDGIAVMLEDEQCPCSVKHVSSGQPVLEHIESNPAVLSESTQTVWHIGLANYFDVLFAMDV